MPVNRKSLHDTDGGETILAPMSRLAERLSKALNHRSSISESMFGTVLVMTNRGKAAGY